MTALPEARTERLAERLAVRLADGTEVPVSVRRSARARRILLHVGAYDGQVELVLPPGCPPDEGLSFARSQTRWLAGQLARVGGAVPFADGAYFPLLGERIAIRRVAGASAVPALDGRELIVGGRPDTVAGRIRRWLRGQALAEIEPRARATALRVGRTPSRIAVRDTRSRWGSCSRAGNLNFSWRLVMAPEHVLDYVVAHEVAHLRELNHSDRFWAVVAELCPDHKVARRWLKTQGADLHRYGRD